MAIPILKMSKLRPREVKDFPKIGTAGLSHCYSGNQYLLGSRAS